MLFTKVLTTLSLALFTLADPAPVKWDSPAGALYLAVFNKGDTKGFVTFFTVQGYVFVFSHIRKLPAQGSPFVYRVHQEPVPSTGNCLGTLGIFDPYDGVPHAPTPAEFKVGDLSGKHGKIAGLEFVGSYADPFMSLNPSNGAFIGDKSVVLRDNRGLRIDCASIVKSKIEDVPNNIKAEAEKVVDELKKKENRT